MALSRRWIAAGIGGLTLTVVPLGMATPVGPASTTGPNLITNGSFESPDIASGTYGIFSSVPGWSYEPRPGTTGTGIEIQDRVAGDPAAGAGDQFAELDSDSPSRIYQNISTQPGATYRLEFIYSPRPGTDAADNHFRVTAGSASAELGPVAGAGQTDWHTHSLDFVADASTALIEFLDLGPPQSPEGAGTYIDAVVVSSVSPTSVALRSFTAVRSGKTVVLRWRTGSQARLLGFDLYRPALGTRTRLNRTLIPARLHGGLYSFRDRAAPRGAKYVLEAHSLDGTRRQYRLTVP